MLAPCTATSRTLSAMTACRGRFLRRNASSNRGLGIASSIPGGREQTRRLGMPTTAGTGESLGASGAIPNREDGLPQFHCGRTRFRSPAEARLDRLGASVR
jgi:hypothetical protein